MFRKPGFSLLLKSALIAAVAGVLLGTLDAILASEGQNSKQLISLLWVSCAAVSSVTVMVGMLQAPLFALLGKLGTKWGLTTWWSIHFATDRDTPRHPVIAIHAIGMAVIPALALVAAGSAAVGIGLRTIQDPTMQTVLQTVAAILLFLVGVLLLAWARRVFTSWLTRFDTKVGLPWPRAELPRYLLYVVIPSFALIVPLLVVYADDLGPLLLGFAFALFLELELLVLLALRKLSHRGLTRATSVFTAIWLLTVVAVPNAMGQAPALKSAGDRGLYTPSALWLLRKITDFDRDGASALYGAADCAAFDSKIGPDATEEPNNGIDENCDGKDEGGVAKKRVQAVQAHAISGELKEAQIKKYNIVWIVVDALRPDRMELHGHERANTPELKKLAATDLLFEQAYAPSAVTHLSIPSMLIGKNTEAIDWAYGPDKSRLEPKKGQLNLAERLKTQGYRTGTIVSAFINKLKGIQRGFDEVLTTADGRKRLGHDGPVTTALAVDFVAKNAKKAPFFLFAYYEDPHKPYAKHGAGFPNYGEQEVDRYDGEIAYVDRYLGLLVDYLKSDRELWNNTILIVTSDHGEEFKEHGATGHGKTCYVETAHVPLVMHIPEVKPARIKQRVALVDIVPTVLELVGVAPEATGELSGQSLFYPILNKGEPKPVLCAITNQGSVMKNRPFYTRGVRDGERLLVHKVLSNEFELYDLSRDPKEQKNIAELPSETERLAALRQLLEANATGNLQKQQLYR